MSDARAGGFVVGVALATMGCFGTVYELQPVPRAGDGASPVKAQVRHVSWTAQPESGDLADHASVGVQVDLYDADASRAFVVGPVRLEARPALGGPPRAFVAWQDDDPTSDLARDAATSGGKPGQLSLSPRSGRTVWVTFDAPQSDPPRGPQRLVVIVPVQGQPDLEIAVADPVPGGPRWPAGRVVGAYVVSGLGVLGAPRLFAPEPLGLAARWSRDRWVLGVGASYTFLYQEALAGGPPAHGASVLAQLTWQPWTWPVAPYVEAGTFSGYQAPPPAYGKTARALELPRVGAGVLLSLGPRLGGAGALPFTHPPSPQRALGLRLGYARWFNTGERGGSGGVELSVERGFGP